MHPRGSFSGFCCSQCVSQHIPNSTHVIPFLFSKFYSCKLCNQSKRRRLQLCIYFLELSTVFLFFQGDGSINDSHHKKGKKNTLQVLATSQYHNIYTQTLSSLSLAQVKNGHKQCEEQKFLRGNEIVEHAIGEVSSFWEGGGGTCEDYLVPSLLRGRSNQPPQ